MVGALRLIVVGLDTHGVELVDKFLGAEHLVHTLGANHHEEAVDFLVELIGAGKDAIVGGLQVEAEDGTTKGSHVRELVQVVQHDIEGLVTTPGESRTGPMPIRTIMLNR